MKADYDLYQDNFEESLTKLRARLAARVVGIASSHYCYVRSLVRSQITQRVSDAVYVF